MPIAAALPTAEAATADPACLRADCREAGGRRRPLRGNRYTDEAESGSGFGFDAAWEASARCSDACDVVNKADWRLATTPPTTLAGVAAVLRFANEIEDGGMEWPATDTVGLEGTAGDNGRGGRGLDQGRKGGAGMKEKPRKQSRTFRANCSTSRSRFVRLETMQKQCVIGSSDSLRDEPGQESRCSRQSLILILRDLQGNLSASSSLNSKEARHECDRISECKSPPSCSTARPQ